MVIFVAEHFTFLNSQTNDDTEDLLLQFLEKLAPENLLCLDQTHLGK